MMSGGGGDGGGGGSDDDRTKKLVDVLLTTQISRLATIIDIPIELQHNNIN